MGVDDYVGLDTTFTERHIDGGPLLRTYALLTVARGELVSDDGSTRDSEGDVYFLEFGIACIGACETEKVITNTDES